MFSKRNQQIFPRKPSPDPNAGHVYFIISPPAKLVKIGRTANVTRRFYDLTLANADHIELAFATPRVIFAAELETEYHLHFRKYRAHHEWFHLTEDIANEIKRLQKIDWTSIKTIYDLSRRAHKVDEFRL